MVLRFVEDWMSFARWSGAALFCLLSASPCAAQEASRADDVDRLLEIVMSQQQQLDAQRQALEELRAQLIQLQSAAEAATPSRSGSTRSDDAAAGAVQTPTPSSNVSPGQAQTPETAQRPLNPTQELAGELPEGNPLQVGPAALRVGGYFGLMGIFRSTNSGGSPGTSFASIPYADTAQGNVSEFRLSSQASRITIRADADFPAGVENEDIKNRRPRFKRLSGYFEMDFNGTTPGTVAVTSSSFGFRLRHAFGEAQYGDRFLLAIGQAFSLMTAPKDQLSIWPGDVELSTAVDTNYLAGMIWDRAPQVRFTWRPSRRFNWAFSAENPEQQIGNSLIGLPECCAGDIEAEYNTGSGELRVPNLMPDFVSRLAFNPVRALHVDVGGVVRVFRLKVAPYDDSFTEVGGGGSVNVQVHATPATKLLLQTAFGAGLGRYVGGLVPDVAFGGDGSISPIPTRSWVAGIEQKLGAAYSLGGYYSGVVADADYFVDASGQFIGFGFPGSPKSNNRKIDEITATFGWQVVSSPARGSVQLGVQTSWLSRTPLSGAGGPTSADSFMVLSLLRYNLP
jgi:hypothetical protein